MQGVMNNAGVWLLGCCIGWVIPGWAAASARDCTAILSSLERLACFDQAAGTPVRVPAVSTRPFVERQPEIVHLVQANEAKRRPEDSRFLISSFPESGDARQQRVVVSAPALGTAAPAPYLVISCLSKISRMQLVLNEALAHNQVRLRLFMDGQPVSPPQPWRVLDTGRVVDAGRGLPAIALLKGLNGGSRLQLESDHPALDGLVFDAEGLGELIELERQACRW